MNWHCRRCGECCTRVSLVTMTVEEAEVLVEQDRMIHLEPGPEPGFVRMRARPCPFYRPSVGCLVYQERPYNCRRYLCGRTSSAEPFEDMPIPWTVLESRDLRRQYAREQRRAQRWADGHGWRRSVSEPAGTGHPAPRKAAGDVGPRSDHDGAERPE